MHGYIWLEEFMYVCRILGDGEPRTAMGSPKNCRRSLESLELGFLAQVYSMLMMLLAAACFVGTCAAVLGKKKRCHERPSQEGEGRGGRGPTISPQLCVTFVLMTAIMGMSASANAMIAFTATHIKQSDIAMCI